MLADAINWNYGIWFVILGVPLLLWEIYGITRKPGGKAGGGDTISEMWYALRNRHPAVVVAMALFLVWLFVHFVFEGW